MVCTLYHTDEAQIKGIIPGENGLSISYKELLAAKELLDIPDKASLKEIKTLYYQQIRKWHPDRCPEDERTCREMSGKINAAYEIISEYCSNYLYSFSDEVIREYMSDEDWWFERFGSDPVWRQKK